MFERLFTLFLSFLTYEPTTLVQINSYKGNLYIEDDCLVFSLAALHDFLGQSSNEKIDYAEFQRQLYQSTLNQDLKAHGGQVVVHHSTGKVETNLYRLERCPSEPVKSVSSDG